MFLLNEKKLNNTYTFNHWTLKLELEVILESVGLWEQVKCWVVILTSGTYPANQKKDAAREFRFGVKESSDFLLGNIQNGWELPVTVLL